MPQLAAVNYQVFQFPLPEDSGRKVHLARQLLQAYRADEAVLMYLQNWAVFPSSGHMPLLERLRQSLGEIRPVDALPGHLFSQSEQADAVSLLILALEFFWDCLVVGAGGAFVCYVSHDEHCDVLSPDTSMLTWAEAVFAS